MTTAAIMTATSSTMPTAVMTESRLKMMSSSMICAMTLQNEATRPASRTWSSPSMRPWISQVALASRKRPPPMRMRSRPEKSCSKSVNSGSVRVTTQLMPSSSRMRMPMAATMPTRRALSR